MYDTTVPLSEAAATGVPWALHLADTHGRYHLLAFDFDVAPHGRAAVDRDVAGLRQLLDTFDVTPLVCESGGGGVHLWVRLADPSGACAADVGRMARTLRHHFPTLDIGALTNPRTGCVRPPGAPHRNGGASKPTHRGSALTATLDRLQLGASVDVVTRITEHLAPPTVPAGNTPRNVLEGPDGPHLPRRRRPLNPAARTLLATTPGPDTDRSALAHAILVHMALTGHTLTDLRATIDSGAPGLERLRDDVARGRTHEVERQWRKALDYASRAATATPPIDLSGTLGRHLTSIETALHINPAEWAKPGGPSDERILAALVTLARQALTLTLDVDSRRLAEMTGLDRSTVSRRLHILCGRGWITQVQQSEGRRSATWQLLPQECTAAPQGEPAPRLHSPRDILEHDSHDLWATGPGLGPIVARIHRSILSVGNELHRLTAATGYKPRSIRKAQHTLRALGMLPTSGDDMQVHRQMTAVATQIGAAGIGRQRALRHRVDRELHAWWEAELAWRRTLGKTRWIPGRHRSDTRSGPRGRYGPFPTHAHKADYRHARQIVQREVTAEEGRCVHAA